jgi:small subunit ribosomal protein S21
MVEKEGIIREYKKREYYEKPSTIKNRKNKALRRKLMKRTRRPYREMVKTPSFQNNNNQQ